MALPTPRVVATGDQIVTESERRARRQDWVRAGVTGCFLLLLLILILFACLAANSSSEHWQQAKELLQIILPALTGLLGSSLGFYFGSRQAEMTNRDNT